MGSSIMLIELIDCDKLEMHIVNSSEQRGVAYKPIMELK